LVAAATTQPTDQTAMQAGDKEPQQDSSPTPMIVTSIR
jgi:hypothetical protein